MSIHSELDEEHVKIPQVKETASENVCDELKQFQLKDVVV